MMSISYSVFSANSCDTFPAICGPSFTLRLGLPTPRTHRAHRPPKGGDRHRGMKILALSGSLRAASINSAVLRAAVRLAPPGTTVSLFKSLGQLPLFNPDLESDVPDVVATFQRTVAQSDALIIASPEYAHGVTGTIKNALDWLVGSEAFAGKPVAVLNTSPRAHHADAALRETLKTMAAVVIEAASVTIPLLGAQLDEASMIDSPSLASAISGSLTALRNAILTPTEVVTPLFPLR